MKEEYGEVRPARLLGKVGDVRFGTESESWDVRRTQYGLNRVEFIGSTKKRYAL